MSTVDRARKSLKHAGYGDYSWFPHIVRDVAAFADQETADLHQYNGELLTNADFWKKESIEANTVIRTMRQQLEAAQRRVGELEADVTYWKIKLNEVINKFGAKEPQP